MLAEIHNIYRGTGTYSRTLTGLLGPRSRPSPFKILPTLLEPASDPDRL